MTTPRVDWNEAVAHLQDVRQRYVEIGSAGIAALTLVLNPLLVRFDCGERTDDLYEAMMRTE